ncbi:MAG: hypothetical protein GWO75_01775 [Bacteroidetes bacterium]|nr:hypothetical protein [Bacteroidota bacterium]
MMPLTYGQIQLDDNIAITAGMNYEIAAIEVTGADHLDATMVGLLSGLNVGDVVQFPSDKVAKAIKNLWDQDLFQDIQLLVTQQSGKVVFLELRLQTLPKLSKYYFTGIKESKQDNLREKLEISRGMVVSENLRINSEQIIKDYYVDKGFPDAWASISTEEDSAFANAVTMRIDVHTGERVRIADILFYGNDNID